MDGDFSGPELFCHFLDLSKGEDRPFVVGGQAVNLWAIHYEDRLKEQIDQYKPFTSKDLDLFGEIETLQKLSNKHGGKLIYGKPGGPVAGRWLVRIDNKERIVEMLWSLPGVPNVGTKDAIQLSLPDGRSIGVLQPICLLTSKIHNCVFLDQTDRNDVKHVHMMILCVREFVRDLLESAEANDLDERSFVNALEDLFRLVNGSDAKHASRLWSFSFDVWPLELTETSLPKVRNYLQHRLRKLRSS